MYGGMGLVAISGGGHGGGGHGGGGHGGGGHGGGGHGGGGHGGGGGHHHGGRRGGRGQTVVVADGGNWGGGWWGGYPDVIVEPFPCAVIDTNGDCVCQLIDKTGRCVATAGLGGEEAAMGSSTSWVAGGLLVLLAVGAYALDKKGPSRHAA